MKRVCWSLYLHAPTSSNRHTIGGRFCSADKVLRSWQSELEPLHAGEHNIYADNKIYGSTAQRERRGSAGTALGIFVTVCTLSFTDQICVVDRFAFNCQSIYQGRKSRVISKYTSACTSHPELKTSNALRQITSQCMNGLEEMACLRCCACTNSSALRLKSRAQRGIIPLSCICTCPRIPHVPRPFVIGPKQK